MTNLETQGLILRPWKETDLGPFAALNADPRVMEHFPFSVKKGVMARRIDDFDHPKLPEGHHLI